MWEADELGGGWNDGSSFPDEDRSTSRHDKGATVGSFDGHVWWLARMKFDEDDERARQALVRAERQRPLTASIESEITGEAISFPGGKPRRGRRSHGRTLHGRRDLAADARARASMVLALCGVAMGTMAGVCRGHADTPTEAVPAGTTASEGPLTDRASLDAKAKLLADSEGLPALQCVGGDKDAKIEKRGENYYAGVCSITTPLPVGYPDPTPPGAIDLKVYPSVRCAEVSGTTMPDYGMYQGVLSAVQPHQKMRDRDDVAGGDGLSDAQGRRHADAGPRAIGRRCTRRRRTKRARRTRRGRCRSCIGTMVSGDRRGRTG